MQGNTTVKVLKPDLLHYNLPSRMVFHYRKAGRCCSLLKILFRGWVGGKFPAIRLGCRIAEVRKKKKHGLNFCHLQLYKCLLFL
jgi:hypothetical protein